MEAGNNKKAAEKSAAFFRFFNLKNVCFTPFRFYPQLSDVSVAKTGSKAFVQPQITADNGRLKQDNYLYFG
jgi:hypothetical protein